ncbi:hypothetical protein ANCCAN_03429 [Ancylostoma caninum]|uniref:Uncharacterized protein n=1 Tax=Ancylostoma caninum TaxID=29170 RepID=A0A368H1B9_ANCCA|nr:hypothetical protein ANCCAN_03429 [Ancylostoma caninum]
MISAKLGTSAHQRFVVDIVPSLSSISRADSFVDSNHERCLESFERRYPVMFALELDVSDEIALLDRNGNVAKDHKDANKNGGNQNNQYSKDIDTADRGKLESKISQSTENSELIEEFGSYALYLVKLDHNALPSSLFPSLCYSLPILFSTILFFKHISDYFTIKSSSPRIISQERLRRVQIYTIICTIW